MVFGLAVLVAVPLVHSGDAKKDQEKMQGSWKVTSMTVGGKSAPAEALESVQFYFKGDKMGMKRPGGDEGKSFSFKLDPTKKPSVITMKALSGQYKDKVNEGIYALEKDTIKICIPNLPGEPRPTKFESPEQSKLILIVLAKEKK